MLKKIIISILFIFINLKSNKININYFINKNSNNIIRGTLIIDRINFKKNIYKNDTLENGLKYERNKSIIITGHSGIGNNAYFNDLVYLNTGDLIIWENKYNVNKYKVENIIYFKKYSKIKLINNKNYLYLITCNIYDLLNSQVIIVCKLI